MDLQLALKAEYFDQIKRGEKVEEYRLRTPYWAKRLEGRDYDSIVLTLGYPDKYCHERRLKLKWRGFELKVITHKHFGPDPVEVYAIRVELLKD